MEWSAIGTFLAARQPGNASREGLPYSYTLFNPGSKPMGREISQYNLNHAKYEVQMVEI